MIAPPGLPAEIKAIDTVAVAVRELFNTIAVANTARTSVESAIAAANAETKTKEIAMKEMKITCAALATAMKEVLEKKAVWLEKDAALLEIQAKNAAWTAKEAENTARAATNSKSSKRKGRNSKKTSNKTKSNGTRNNKRSKNILAQITTVLQQHYNTRVEDTKTGK